MEIKCTLACGEKSRFQGIGIAIVEVSPGNFVILAPAYLSTKDDVCTISPGALKRYSKCLEASHEALEYLKIKLHNKRTVKINVETAAGLDYVKIKLHHFKRPMKTKLQRNPFLFVRPKQLIFRSGLKPQDPASINRVESDPSSTSETEGQGMAPSELLPKAASDRSTGLRSSDSAPRNSGQCQTMKHLSHHHVQDQLLQGQLSTLHTSSHVPVVTRTQVMDKSQQACYWHIKLGHMNMEYVEKIAKSGIVKGMPKSIGNLKYECPLCKIAAAPRIPRGGPVDTTELRKGVRYHADYVIFNVESCRGFKTALLITEATSRRKWGFPTRSRSPPVHIMRWVVNHLRRIGYPVLELRVDEDGALARSTNFMKLCVEELEMNVQGTGGYNSTNNGMVESPIKPIKRMVRVFLLGAAMPDILWCYAFCYAVYVSNHRWNRTINDVPIVKWHDGNYELDAARDLVIFGSKCYIITKADVKKQLQMRTEKDPRKYMGITVDESVLPEHCDGYFVGYAGHNSVLLVWDSETNKVRRTHHAYIDEFQQRVLATEQLTPHAVLLQDLPPAALDSSGNLDPRKIKMVTSYLQETKHALDPEKSATITVTLPRKGKSLGLTFKSDETYGFPLLTKVSPTSPLRTQIPMDMQRNCWLVAINSENGGHIEPITDKFCMEELIRCQIPNEEKTIQLTFHRKIRPVHTELQTLRMMSDQSPGVSPIVRHIVALPERPVAERSIYECLKGPNRPHWKAALSHQYGKNADHQVLSTPVAREKIPDGTKVYQSIIACRVKDAGPGMYKFEARHCVHGGPMEKGRDFDFSCAPTISYPGFRVVLCYSAAKGKILKVADVSNCFQSDASVPIEKRIFINAPVHYVEWFEKTYPDIKFDKSKSGKYVLQTINSMQGRKDASRSWYLLLKEILEDFGFHVCPNEPALFVCYEGESEMIVVTSTDDFLCSYDSEDMWNRFMTHMNRFVKTTCQEGKVLKYLSTRVIQSDMGISFDQTSHIITRILDKWFPANSTERLKTADTPYRTDGEFERAINETLPATGEELARLEKEYGGKYNAHIGEFLHIQQVSRFELGFALSRLSQYNVAPNEPAFQGLKRMARFLATHTHAPIFYPRLSLKMYQTIRFEVEPGKFVEHVISNLFQFFKDSDHARDIKTRKSITCVLAAMLGVLVHWQMGKQSCIAAHSTDAEIRAFFTAMMQNRYFRPMLEYLRIPLREATVIWEDNQPAIDIMTANQITSRVKHMAVPIAMINEDIQNGTCIPKKISGILNPADIGTKPLPASTLHRHWRWGRGHRFYPPVESEHGTLMQVDRVMQRMTEFDTASPSYINYKQMRDFAAVYDTKNVEEKKKASESKGP